MRSEAYRTDSDPGEPYFDPGPVREPVREKTLWQKVVAAMLADARMGIPPTFGDEVEDHDAACDHSRYPRNVRRMAGGKAGLVRKWVEFCCEPWFREMCSMAEMDADKTAREIEARAKESRW